MFQKAQYSKAVSRERSIAPFIPQSSHVSETTIVTLEGDLQRTWRVQGVSFETADPEDVHVPKERLNNLVRSIGNSKVSLWQHTCQVRTKADLPGDYQSDYCREFDRRYGASINTEDMMVTELYLTLVYLSLIHI